MEPCRPYRPRRYDPHNRYLTNNSSLVRLSSLRNQSPPDSHFFSSIRQRFHPPTNLDKRQFERVVPKLRMTPIAPFPTPPGNPPSTDGGFRHWVHARLRGRNVRPCRVRQSCQGYSWAWRALRKSPRAGIESAMSGQSSKRARGGLPSKAVRPDRCRKTFEGPRNKHSRYSRHSRAIRPARFPRTFARDVRGWLPFVVNRRA